MEATSKCVLILSLVAFFGYQDVQSYGIQDFRDWNMFPVNTYKNRVIFFLDSDCDPTACQNSCSVLNFGTGLCSAMPRTCLCNAQTELTTDIIKIGAINGTESTRVYRFGNDWSIYPTLNCDLPGPTAAKEFCERSCQQYIFNHGTCLKFTSRNAVCACRTSYRRPTVSPPEDADPDEEIPQKAPFPVIRRRQRVGVRGSSVYLSNDLCLQASGDCENICSQFNLANGKCDDYFNRPACRCDTGINETRVATDLQIKSYAGGIYTLNGWHLFEHDPEMKCTIEICAHVCQFWGFNNEVKCFPGNGITNSCGCLDYVSKVPSPEELEEARKSSAPYPLKSIGMVKIAIMFFLAAVFYSS